MNATSDNHVSIALAKVRHWQRLIEKTTLAFAAACAGVVLYLALFPSFYYMAWIFLGMMLWAAVAAGCLFQTLALQAIARWKRVEPPSSAANGHGFVFGMLVVVSLLIAFRVPLHASFLLARPGLEQALEQHHDDLGNVGLVSHNYGIYQIGHAVRRCHHKDRVFFQFRNDGEAAIIYSESGIDDLCYNSGNKGHLFGNWYWMKED
ncbi:MAG: hypothetical protein ACO3JG_11330 [Luteolibacter sp.]